MNGSDAKRQDHVMVQNETRETEKPVNVEIAFGNGSKICKERQTNAKINRRRCYFSYVFLCVSSAPVWRSIQMRLDIGATDATTILYNVQFWKLSFDQIQSKMDVRAHRVLAGDWELSASDLQAAFRLIHWCSGGRTESERERGRKGENDLAHQSPGSAHSSFNPTTMAC